MLDFNYQNGTKIHFGRNTEQDAGTLSAAHGKTVLLHYGQGSIRESGLYDRVLLSLEKEGLRVIELGGVKPNPTVELARQGIDLCRKERIDMILAVGGGSVIDSAKAIAAGVHYDGDVWDFYSGNAEPENALPVGVILTIPAAGSESSMFTVLSNPDGQWKKGFGHPLLRPVFAILNPELTYTLPAYQTACGASDMLAHVMERYFSNTPHVHLSDRLCEGVMKTIIEMAPLAIMDPEHYDVRAELMWAGTVAHHDFLNSGRETDWASHGIEHEISALYDIAHGAGLSIVFPAWLRYVVQENPGKIAQFANRVFGIELDFDQPDRTAMLGIEALEDFYIKLGLPVRFCDADIDENRISEMAQKATGEGAWTLGTYRTLNTKDVERILQLAT